MDTSESTVRDDEIFQALFSEMPEATRAFYTSLQGTRYFDHYRDLLVRYVTHRGRPSDLLRMMAFNIHHLSFYVRRKIGTCLRGEDMDVD